MLLLLLLTGLSGCERHEEERENIVEETVIPVTFLVNADTGQNENEDLVTAFNQAYEGVYRVEVEWLSDDAEGYRSRIKTLNGLDKLPAVITDVGFDYDFYQLLLDHDRLVDVSSDMEASSEWREAVGEQIMESCQEEDGSMYLSPSGNLTHNYAGFYYNKELFAQAGIESFPTTWEGVFDCVDRLKENNIVGIGLNGSGSYWTAMLIGTNYMAASPQGMDFLNTQYPKDYQKDCLRDMFTMLKRMYTYGHEDVMNIQREEAAVRFINGENAIISNGGWMMDNFPEEVKERTGFAPFPGNILMQDAKMSAWAVTSGYDEKVTQGAVKFLEYRAVSEHQEGLEFLEEDESSLVETEYKQAVSQAEIITPNYQLKWESAIQYDFLTENFPLYYGDELSLNDFLDAMNETAAAIEAEK